MMLVCFCIAIVTPVLYWLYMTHLNNARAKMRAESGEANVVIRNEDFLDLADREQLHFKYVK